MSKFIIIRETTILGCQKEISPMFKLVSIQNIPERWERGRVDELINSELDSFIHLVHAREVMFAGGA